jgi:hypothetical protein
LQKARRKVSFTVEEIGYSLGALLQPVAGSRAKDFHPIARRYDQTFANNVPVHQTAQSSGTGFVGEGQQLTHFHWRRLVVYPD